MSNLFKTHLVWQSLRASMRWLWFRAQIPHDGALFLATTNNAKNDDVNKLLNIQWLICRTFQVRGPTLSYNCKSPWQLHLLSIRKPR